ncbi:hypothetical protein SNEBB_005890 [Seison nebaliae]|nr:hypothetical protein SNEBB_005890 [Seison nebaliae]
MGKKKEVYYAVHRGRKTGIFSTWRECEYQVKGYAQARYKKFEDLSLAENFVAGKFENSSSFDKKGKVDNFTTNKLREKIDIKMNEEPLDGYQIIYTDGACRNNGKGNTAAGIGVFWGVDHRLNVGEALPLDYKQTNNCSEILAIKRAISDAIKNDYKKICIKTDSQFAINCITKWMRGWAKNGWKTGRNEEVKNKRELNELKMVIDQNDIQIKYIHVDGHRGIEGNERADELANEGADEQIRMINSKRTIKKKKLNK